MRMVDRMIHWHRWLLRLYPRSFQDAFGDELQSVFTQALREAAGCQVGASSRSIWRCFLRELFDLPLNLLREYASHPGLGTAIEHWLTHPQRSRWQQAAMLAFALGFALLELLHGLSQIFVPGKHLFASWWGFYKLSPADAQVILGRVYNLPDSVDYVWLLISGLIIGMVFSLAEREPSWIRRLGLALTGAVAMVFPYSVLTLVNLTLQAPLAHYGQAVSFLTGIAVAVFALWLVGGLPSVLFGRIVGVRNTWFLANLSLTGMGGLLAGLLLGLLAGLPFFVLVYGAFSLFWRNVSPFDLPWGVLLAFHLFLAILSGAVQGWVYGRVMGGKIAVLAKLRPA